MTHSTTPTTAEEFDNIYSANLIGLWDFLPSDPDADTGLADGVAQDGAFYGASAHNGELVTNGNGAFQVHGDDAPFDLEEGTIMLEFNQTCHNGSSPDTLVSRGEYDDRYTEGFLDIRVTADGAVEVQHVSNGVEICVSTSDCFFNEGDDVQVFYSWSDDGGALKVVNTTQGTEETVEIDADMSMDIGDNDGQSFTFAAREYDDGCYDQSFTGTMNYVAIYDDDVITEGEGDGVVDGTAGDDVIDLAYDGDPEGDMIDNGDAILPGETGDDDIVEAGDGNDTVYSEEGDDEVYAGGGNDTVHGGAGNDVIYGDSSYDGGATGSVREVFQWSEAPDPNGPAPIEAGDPITGFSQDTGSVNVTFSVLNADPGVANYYETIGQATSGIDDDGNAVDANSSFSSVLNGDHNDADYELAFSDEVENVSFRINDLDGDGVVKVTAYDADGNAVEVELTVGSNLSLTDTDTVAGGDTAQQEGSDENYSNPDDLANSVLVEIAGPVARIEIAHDQDGHDNSGINFTDVYFDAGSAEEPGDDVLYGDEGDDEIYGEAGDDVLVGGEGNDLLSGGDDADIFGVGVGDTVIGGEGGDDNDTIIVDGLATVAWTDGDPTTESGTITYYDDDLNVIGTADFSEIEDVLAINTQGAPTGVNITSDSLDGVVEGTAGGDTIDTGYTDDPDGDLIDGDDAVPPLTGEQDVALGFTGNDVIYGGEDTDLLFGGEGNDEIYGQEGADGLSGGIGDDILSGGEGSDIVAGGAGNDTVSGDNDVAGDAGDLLFGDTGDDTFVNIGAGDIIDGGEDADDNDIDTLDLTGAAEAVNPGGTLSVEYDAVDPESGTVRFYDAGGSETGTASFSNIEKVVICFTPGTLIATPKGEKPVESLTVGDRVITRDNGIQEIRWMGQRNLNAMELAKARHMRPVLIRKGSLGNGLPERDMMLSPNHRVLVANDKTALYFDESEVLVAAKHLTGLDGVDEVEVGQVTYLHMMFDHHEVVLSDGAWTESFQPGDYSLAGIGNAQRTEIFELFPELETEAGLQDYQSARRALKKHEVRVLFS